MIDKISNYKAKTLEDALEFSSICLLLVLGFDDFKLLMIKRPANLNSYSNDYCFPGGKMDKTDLDLKITALRELEEEVYISKEKIRLVGQLDDFKTINNCLVRPFVMTVHKEAISKNIINSEVSHIELFALTDLILMSDSEKVNQSKRNPNYEYKLPNGDIIWGLSSSIIAHLRNIVLNENNIIDKECLGYSLP